MSKENLITLAIVVVGVVIAIYAMGKLGLNSYEEYPV